MMRMDEVEYLGCTQSQLMNAGGNANESMRCLETMLFLDAFQRRLSMEQDEEGQVVQRTDHNGLRWGSGSAPSGCE